MAGRGIASRHAKVERPVTVTDVYGDGNKPAYFFRQL